MTPKTRIRIRTRSRPRLGGGLGAGVSIPRPLGAFVAAGSFVPRLTQPAFERFGFARAALLLDWPAIAGPALARFTSPDKLRWARVADEAPAAEGEEARGKWVATLWLRVDGGRALDVAYGKAQLVERINQYFGYRAVIDIRVIQAPVAGAQAAPPAPPPRKPAALPPEIGAAVSRLDVAPQLKDALARLGANVVAKSGPAR